MKTDMELIAELQARIAELEGARAKDAVEMERLQAERNELSDQFIANSQRLMSVCDNWHNWAVEIVGEEAASKMSGQDMRDEILRRLADRVPAQAEPEKRCTSVSLGGNRCCKEAGHSGLCSTKSGGVSWDAQDLGAVPLQPPTFTPAPTSEELPGLTDFRGRLNWLVKQLGHGDYGRPEVEAAKRIRDHAAAVKRVGELENELGTERAMKEGCQSRLLALAEIVRVSGVVLEPDSGDTVEKDRLTIEILKDEVARLSAPCPADWMSDLFIGEEVMRAYEDAPKYSALSAAGAKARALFARPAR